ncbi:trypsin-like peptidase domain-containing protein [Patescibacteria group bacterium]|nr:trypsin-like peptidase domain-containing protein [Patescibacteria group bacterium]
MPLIEFAKLVIAFLILGILVIYTVSLSKQTVVYNKTPATKDLSVEEVSNTETSMIQELQEIQETIVPEKEIVVMQEEIVASTIPVIPQPVPLIPIQSFLGINEITRAALVNILCTTTSGGLLNPITGSGVIIDSRGVILTNAHIAQYFLLRDYPNKDAIECIIRGGSPAEPLYTAEILHISTEWITDNTSNITNQNPMGTGVNDYAFLFITNRINSSEALPNTFVFIQPDVKESSIIVGNNVLVAGYPAGFLSGITIQKDLYAVSTISEIMELFTFGDNMLDLISLGGSITAQKGSSGGAIVNSNSKLIGVVVTSSDGETTAERDLRAITLSHIERSLKKNNGFGLEILLFGDLRVKSNLFNLSTSPALTELLVNELKQ